MEMGNWFVFMKSQFRILSLINHNENRIMLKV